MSDIDNLSMVEVDPTTGNHRLTLAGQNWCAMKSAENYHPSWNGGGRFVSVWIRPIGAKGGIAATRSDTIASFEHRWRYEVEQLL